MVSLSNAGDIKGKNICVCAVRFFSLLRVGIYDVMFGNVTYITGRKNARVC